MGVYRDGIRLLPIRMRAPESERGDIGVLRDTQVWSPVLRRSVPVSQVVNGYETRWENSVIRSRNRIQTIIASCNPVDELAGPLFLRLRPQIEAIELPPGYQLEWGGEYEDSRNAQAGLAKSLPVGFLLMILTSIFLFGKLRQPLIIWLTVPLAIIGITVGLLGTGGAFDFMSLLGALSLMGLLIKNAIVLIEEIDQQIDSGKEPYDSDAGFLCQSDASGGAGGGDHDPGSDSPVIGCLFRQYVGDDHGGTGLCFRTDADRGAYAVRGVFSDSQAGLNALRVSGRGCGLYATPDKPPQNRPPAAQNQVLVDAGRGLSRGVADKNNPGVASWPRYDRWPAASACGGGRPGPGWVHPATG